MDNSPTPCTTCRDLVADMRAQLSKSEEALQKLTEETMTLTRENDQLREANEELKIMQEELSQDNNEFRELAHASMAAEEKTNLENCELLVYKNRVESAEAAVRVEKEQNKAANQFMGHMQITIDQLTRDRDEALSKKAAATTEVESLKRQFKRGDDARSEAFRVIDRAIKGLTALQDQMAGGLDKN